MAVHRPTRTFLAFTVLSLIYLVLIMLLPANTVTLRTYHLSLTEFRIFDLLLGIPRIIVWFAAFYGYAKLDAYAATIHDTTDGKAFRYIGRGLRYLAWGLPIVTIITNIAGGIAHAHPGFTSSGLIITHFANLIVSLVAFTLISSGTRRLLETAGKQVPIAAIRAIMLSFIVLAISYCYVTVRDVQTQNPNPYRMPMWLILFTVVVPYLYAWLMGLFASYEISLYSKQVRGLLYQRALSLLAWGLGMAIIGSVVVQYNIASSDYLRRIHLDWRLLVLYAALIVYAAGFVLIASGAGRLKRIEDV